MKDRNRGLALLLVAAALGTVVAGTGCRRVPIEDVDSPTVFGGAIRETSDSVQTEGAESLVAHIEMGAGELAIDGGAPAGTALEGSYRFTDDDWAPDVTYDVQEGEGRLGVSQRDMRAPHLGSVRNEWDLALPADVPLDLTLAMGAGDCTLDLKGTQLRKLELGMGAGEADVDLSGDWTEDVTADLTAGVGEFTLRVPEGVGVRIWGSSEGIGEYNVDDGFRRDGDYYVNDAWDDGGVRMDIRLQRGVGEINVEMVP